MLKIVIADKEYTIDEAKKLYDDLRVVFEASKIDEPLRPNYLPVNPPPSYTADDWWKWPQVTFCDLGIKGLDS